MSSSDDLQQALERFMNRRIYHDLSPAVIESIADDDLEQAIIDYVTWQASVDSVPEDALLERVPPAVSAVYTTRLAEDEVANGGFNQLFFNRMRNLLERAAAGYRMVGAPEHERIATAALKRAVEAAPALEAAWETQTMEAFSASYKLGLFDDLDATFNELDEREDASAIRIRYIRSHASEMSA
jgi:Domain of unknown function (DUF4375)